MLAHKIIVISLSAKFIVLRRLTSSWSLLPMNGALHPATASARSGHCRIASGIDEVKIAIVLGAWLTFNHGRFLLEQRIAL